MYHETPTQTLNAPNKEKLQNKNHSEIERYLFHGDAKRN